ncbi:MAG TPA: ABC transporter permease [Rectinemataceae bacterium]|nr:ABC transporter permease [Rectinemataceae bacterium]
MKGPFSHEGVAARFVALAASFALAALYPLLASPHPLPALRAFFYGPFSNLYNLLGLLEAAAPLLVCALGASLAFRAGVFNLGGEGQAAVGTLASALTVQALGGAGLPASVVLPCAILAAAAAGSLLALLSTAAELWSGADVLLTSFLLSQAALVVVDWAVGGPLKAASSNLLAMPPIPTSLRLPRLAAPSTLSLAAPIALGLALLVSFAVERSRSGYELKLYGRNRLFARSSGIGEQVGTRAMAASGAMAGIAGAFLVLGIAGRAVKGMTGGVGWNGLAVALISGSHPIGAVPASLFFAWLDAGARQGSIMADLSPDASIVMKAVALFLITARIGSGWRPRRTWMAGAAGRGE